LVFDILLTPWALVQSTEKSHNSTKVMIFDRVSSAIHTLNLKVFLACPSIFQTLHHYTRLHSLRVPSILQPDCGALAKFIICGLNNKFNLHSNCWSPEHDHGIKVQTMARKGVCKKAIAVCDPLPSLCSTSNAATR